MRLKKAQDAIRQFSAERGWAEYHNLKNLIVSLAVEAGELLSLIEWMSDSQVEDALKQQDFRKAVEDEVSDVFHHILSISNKLGIDPIEAFNKKFENSKQRFPVEKAKKFDPVAWKLKKIKEKKEVHL